MLIQEEHTAPLASVWCWYKVGSKDERPGLTGVSHWVEHMNFKGTTNIPRDQVKGIIEQFGGSWNGYTWIDQTTYLETATRDALDRMLFIESERMANCLYHPDDCESERTVIISELQGGENDPDQLLDQEVTATAFKAHPYRHPTIGWLSDLQTMTRDDLFRYYRRYYVPNNATLVIVGDVDTDDAIRRVEQHFGRIQPGSELARVRTVEPEQTGERRVTIRREGTTAYLKVSFHAPAATDARLLPDGDPRCRAHRREGPEPVVEFPRRAAAAQRAAVSLARRARSRVERLRLDRRRPQDPFLYTVSVTATEGTSLAGAESVLLDELDRVTPRRHHRRRARQGEGATQGAARVRQRQRDEHRASARLLRDDRQRESAELVAVADRGGHAWTKSPRPRARSSLHRTARSGGSSRCRSANDSRAAKAQRSWLTDAAER